MPSQYGPISVNVNTGALEYAGGTVDSSSITDGSIVNADVNASAAIAASKLSGVTTTATLTTKGDIYAASAASTPARVGVGANNTVLVADSAQTSGVKWAAVASLPGLVLPFFRSGKYYGTPGTTSTASPTLNNCRVSPLVVPVAISIDRIGLEVTTLGAGGAVGRLGIWNDDGNGYPSTVLLDAGTIDATGTGVKEITLSPAQALTPGIYWIGAACQGATFSWRTVSSAQFGVGAESAATLTSNAAVGYIDTQSTTLATWTSTMAMSASAPHVMVRIV